ncbi:GDSL esterase/lipase EXL3-like [Andrographis paniculata]|uniref:GDSL esterase/lipase EXL3-like n=1 Tax=Andrographis paniculata TaxID=175694 RepID=UPI0021E7BD1C|nr:GDSL esterase/lipase EXL3-like [Andrographis paniculata]
MGSCLAVEFQSVLSFPAQMKLFQEYMERVKGELGEEAASSFFADSLYLLVAGTNDIANTYFTIGTRRLEYSIASYARFLVSKASTFIQELHQHGARRIGVLGTPPIGCLPLERTLAGGLRRNCNEVRNKAAQVVNTELLSELDSLSKSLADSKIVYLEIYELLLQLIENPEDFGFEVSDRGCCGTGIVEAAVLCNPFSATCEDHSKYVFWDTFHPTEKAYQILVDRIIELNFDKFL